MFKRLVAILLSLCLCVAFAGCKNEEIPISVDEEPQISSEEEPIIEEPTYYVNPLTGEVNLDKETSEKRPFAVMINNINVAQPVQSNVGKADVVYETLVEGGVTRLLAVFQDTTKLDKIGTVRSARYAFIDLALGHNAIYVHHGQDSYHAGPHLNDINRLVVEKGKGGVRVSNGLAKEHTLYAYGQGIYDMAVSYGFETKNSSTATWQTFSTEDAPVSLENAANSVSVPFSASYNTKFVYDTASGKYIRYFNGTERKDCYSGESLYFKNIFVLNTTIRNYNCSSHTQYQHREVLLQSGDGYYFVNGTYTPIKWSKGAAKNGFTFTYADGTPLTVNQGNSWVCIADLSSVPVIE